MSKATLVFNIQKLSTEDGPGIRTTVFFKGCPLKCKWCHNPEGIDPRPQLMWTATRCIGCKTCIKTCKNDVLKFTKAGLQIDREKCKRCGDCADECPSTALELIGKKYDPEQLFIEVEKDRPFYEQSKGGVTCSGGEATMQHEALRDFLKICKERGLQIALDTCGYIKTEKLGMLLDFVDLVLYDLKVLDPEKHKAYTGVPNELILENVKYIAERGVPIWIRTPIIPGHTDSEENIREIAQFITEYLLPTVQRYDLCAFVNLCRSKYERLGIDWFFKDTPPMTKAEMEHLAEIAREVGVPNVVWSGPTRRED
ncbi:MAG: glycyl-radical enzyme activating protein [Candidatus Helarchaeota archaeon]